MKRLTLYLIAITLGATAAIAAYNADVTLPEWMRIIERSQSPAEPRLPLQDDPAQLRFFSLPMVVS